MTKFSARPSDGLVIDYPEIQFPKNRRDSHVDRLTKVGLPIDSRLIKRPLQKDVSSLRFCEPYSNLPIV